MQPHRLAPLLLALSLAGGCASVGVIHSLDDITAHVDQKGFFTLEQQRLLALSGLMPAGPPGSAYQFRGNRSPFTAIGLAEPTTNDKGARTRATYVLRRSIPYAAADGTTEGTPTELIQLRNQLELVRSKAIALITAQLQLAIARGGAVLERQQAEVQVFTEKVNALRTEFEKARRAAVTMVQRPGVMVIRTNTIRQVSLGARIGAFFGLSAQRSSEHSGFAVLAGLETETLYVGADFDTWCDPPGKDWALIGDKFPFVFQTQVPFIGQSGHHDIRVVTSRFAAHHVLYTSDQLRETSLQGKLELTEEALDNIDKVLSKVDQLAVEAVLESVENLGSLGILGQVEQKRIDREAWSEDRSCDCERAQVIYQVLTEYDDVLALSQDRTRLHFIRL